MNSFDRLGIIVAVLMFSTTLIVHWTPTPKDSGIWERFVELFSLRAYDPPAKIRKRKDDKPKLGPTIRY